MLRLSIILFFAFILSGQHILAQKKVQRASGVYPEHRYYPLNGEVFFKAYRQVKGNAYLTDDWITGTITLQNGKELKNVKFKADVYKHYIIVYNEYLKRVISLPQADIKSFVYEEGGQRHEFRLIEANRNLKNLNNIFFLEVLKEGHISFYKLYYRDVTPLRTPEMPFIDEFVPNVNYFLVYQDDWVSVKLKRSSLTKRYPEYKSEIKQFFRKNKLRPRREKDFAEAVDYLGQILELVNHAE
jgi:hypothetical protein